VERPAFAAAVIVEATAARPDFPPSSIVIGAKGPMGFQQILDEHGQWRWFGNQK